MIPGLTIKRQLRIRHDSKWFQQKLAVDQSHRLELFIAKRCYYYLAFLLCLKTALAIGLTT
jgi:hypothetical protein